LVLARGFGGAGSALFIAGLQTRILRVIEPEAMGRATGIWRGSFLVGAAAGPFFGGIVAQHFGLAAPFLFYATGLLFATVIAWFAMASKGRAAGSAERRTPIEALRAARPLLHDIRYVAALAATFVGWWTLTGPVQTVGAIFARQELHFSQTRIGSALTLIALGEVITLLTVSRLADKKGRRYVLLPALFLTGTGVALMGQTGSAEWLFYVLMVVIGGSVAAGSIAAGGLLADAVSGGSTGAAVGVNYMAGDMGYLLSPVLVGLVAENAGFGAAYLFAAIPAVVVLFIAWRLPRGILPGRSDQSALAEVPGGPELADRAL
jgi:MFS family permease